jgi:sugar lactone lactonase YvrE
MRKRKRIFAVLLTVGVWLSGMPGIADAAVPYRSYGYFDHRPYPIQSLYVPVGVIGAELYTEAPDGVREAVPGLNGPTDLFIDDEGYLYVSDTNNNRVVKMDDQGTLLLEFGAGENDNAKLNAPEGVYVASNGNVYVCDTGNNRIAVYDAGGRWIDEIGKPDAVSLKDVTFIPSRVSMDARGFLYVAAKGVNEGLIVISPDKQFAGFFGSNKVQLSLLDRLKYMLYSEKQRRSSAFGAASVTDVFIDREGFVYTTTSSAKSEQIKKYNVGGDNLFDGKNFRVDDRLALSGSYSGITVDHAGNIYAIDSGAGRIYQFDRDGNPMLSFGRKLTDSGLRVGMFGDPVSIKMNEDGYLFVTDRLFNGVQVFRPTAFMKMIQKADDLFNAGQYAEAKQAGEEILKRNAFYYKAHYIIGKALYREGQWKAAMARFKRVRDTASYSEAFWEWRVEWVRTYFGVVAAAFVVIFFSFAAVVQYQRRRRNG